MGMIRTSHIAAYVALLVLAGEAQAKPRKAKAAKAERGGPRTLIFDAASPAAAPQVLIVETPPSAVPATTLFAVTIGTEEDGKRSSVVVEEKSMILDNGKTAKP